MRCIGLNAVVAAGLVIAGAGPVFAANGVSAPNAPARAEMTDDGQVLVTPAGMTLYVFGGDAPGQSRCTNKAVTEMKDVTSGFGMVPLPGHQFMKSCVEKWPPYLAADNAQASGVWSLIVRPEGGKQWAYNSSPLYTSVKDHQPGDRNGVVVVPVPGGGGVGGRGGWHLAAPPLDFPPEGLSYTQVADELVLAGANTRPLYTPQGKSAQQAEELFHPIAAPAAGKVSGDWSIVESGAGTQQYAFRGMPLFAAPESLSDTEIAEAGGWKMVVYRKIAGPPPEVQTRFTLLGDVYTTKAGMTLYMYNCGGRGGPCDDPGDGAASLAALCGTGEECAKRWHPYLAAADAKPRGEWSVVEVSYPMFVDPAGQIYPPETPRVKAWAYRGRPVYTYYMDKKPKDVFGDSIRWFSFSNFAALRVPGRGLLD